MQRAIDSAEFQSYFGQYKLTLLVYFMDFINNCFIMQTPYKVRNYHERRISTEIDQESGPSKYMFSSAEHLSKRILTQYSPQKKKQLPLNKLLNDSPRSKFFKNNTRISKPIFNSTIRQSPLKFFKKQSAPNPEKKSQMFPKKSRLILIDELANRSNLLRQSKSTQCPTPKQPTKVFCGSVCKFQTIRPLGHGRFGDVYLARHKKTGFLGALKIIRKCLVKMTGVQKRSKIIEQIASEIKLQWFLDHPNLIKLYDFFDDRDNIYLFVQLAFDGHLYNILNQKGVFSEQSTAIITRQILKGVSYMHKHQIMHRDLKLQNIVLTHGMAKICDFGWSVHEPNQLRKTICGTPLYLSPQMLKGQDYNFKSDVWAVGLLAYELISSQNPFRIRRREDLDNIIFKEAQLSVGSFELKNFVNFILRKDPKKRPSAQILLEHPFLKKYDGLDTSQEICDIKINHI